MDAPFPQCQRTVSHMAAPVFCRVNAPCVQGRALTAQPAALPPRYRSDYGWFVPENLLHGAADAALQHRGRVALFLTIDLAAARHLATLGLNPR